MPIYEYQCKACDHEFEALQKMSEDHLTDCPECKEPELKKLISAAGFRLKGSGWYESDFKGSSASKQTTAKAAASSSSSAASSSASGCSGSGCGCS